jgi:cytochrome c oxidase subunit 2
MNGQAFGLFPVQASTIAPRIDTLYLALVGLTAFFGILISALVIIFAIKYRRREPGEIGAQIRGALALELMWTAIPLGIVLVIFLWSANLFVSMAQEPGNALDVYIVGKQWMWKVQHRDGQQEINALHVPVGTTIQLTLTSQDVIHDFFIPAFRVKTDVVPGKYTRLWFTPTRAGRYHLFCAEYCGTNHSGMIGEIVVLGTRDYENWLASSEAAAPLAAAGHRLFRDLECDSCHRAGSEERGPDLIDVFGSEVLLDGGQRVVADADYLRRSMLTPQSQVVAGFTPQMPSFQGVVNEEQVVQLIEYIRSLSTNDSGRRRLAAALPRTQP